MQVLTPARVLPTLPPKMRLPIEILEQIMNYMPVQTQLRFARTNRAMRDMVYDDSRWIAKLKAMDIWNEEDAKRALEEEITLRKSALQKAQVEAVLGRAVTNSSATTTLFDVSIERKKLQGFPVSSMKETDDLLDFQFEGPEAFGEFQSVSGVEDQKMVDYSAPLNILSSVVSRRGQARSEFGRVYKVLAPLYIDLANSSSPDRSMAFRHRERPEERAKLLKVLELFGRARAVDNWTKCQREITRIIEAFERQMLNEFEE
jgi:recyclin-1